MPAGLAWRRISYPCDALCSSILVAVLVASPAWAGDASSLIGGLPAGDSAASEGILKQLVAAGPNGIAQLVSMLNEPGKGDDSKVRLALHGLAFYVTRPGADAEREMYSRGVCAMLGRTLPPGVKRFLVTQLRIAGGSEAVRTLGALLSDPELCQYAARALTTIGEGAEYLRKTLPVAKGPSLLALVQGLGILRDEQAVPSLLTLAAAQEPQVRLSALEALAEIGDARAIEVLRKAADVESPSERARGTDALLRLARRLVEEGQKGEAIKVYQGLWQSRADAEEAHIRMAAMQGITEAKAAKVRPAMRREAAPRPSLRPTASGGPPEVAPEVLDRWDRRLRTAVDDAIKAGRTVRFRLESMRMDVKAARIGKDGTLTVNARGAELGIPWKRLRLAEKKNLAVSVAGSDPETNAVAAFYCLAAGDKVDGSRHLQSAGEAGAEVRKAFE